LILLGNFTQIGSIYADSFIDRNNTSYYTNPAAVSQFSEVYADNWFRPQGATGVYWQSYDTRFFSNSSAYIYSRSDNGRILQDRSGNNRGYVYFDGNGFGLLHSGGSWAINIHPSNNSRVTLGGHIGLNAYSNAGARLMFVGGDDDATSNYYIGTNLDNYGGNYSKLDLR